MHRRHEIADADWDRIKHLLPGQPGQHGGVAEDNRLFVNAVLYVARTGIPWRDLPERLGKWNSVWKRLDRWAQTGVWGRVMAALRDEDLEWLILDSTTVRAHPCAAGAKRRWDGSGGQDEQALGKSRGGFGTKVHASVSPLGHPVELKLTAAQESDIRQGEELLADHEPQAVIADKGYDGDAFVAAVEARGAEAVIPPMRHRKQQRAYDRDLYKERNVCERFWSWVKQYRRVATRYEKKARNFLAFVQVAAIMVMLR